jgi:small conductance mechanosensitive channel
MQNEAGSLESARSRQAAPAESLSGDIEKLVQILKDDQKRQELIQRLETAAGPEGDGGREAPPDGSGSLLEELADTGQDAAAYIEHTFTSLPALLDLARRAGMSLGLLLVFFVLWRLLKRRVLPLVRSAWLLKVLSAVVFGLALASGILSVWGVEVYALLTTGAGRALLSSGTTIIFVVAAAYAAWEFVNRLLYRHITRISLGDAWDRRLQTVLPLIRSGLLAVICVITVLVVLSELGINIAPLLAGAGIVGLAIGFGAQTLVKDLLTGFFVLLENTINVDDWVILGGHDGQVEGLTIRHVMVRDIYGNLHTVPWSSVVSITNQTRDFGYAVVEVGFAYRENIDEVVDVVKEVADGMRRDPEINEGILGELQILGLIELGDSAVVVRTRFKTQPFMRWRLERDFRRRIKNRFDELGIEIPYPHHTVYFGENKEGRAAPARIRVQNESGSEGPA